VEAVKALAQLGVNKEAKDDQGRTPLHHAAAKGHVEEGDGCGMIKVLVKMGAELGAQTAAGEAALPVSIRMGHHQAAQVLRELERTARAQKVAKTSERARERAQQAAEQADCNAAALIEEEEREQAAKAQTSLRSCFVTALWRATMMRRYTKDSMRRLGAGGGVAERLHASCRHLAAEADVEGGERGQAAHCCASRYP
jgi:hypothetical protein